MSKHLWNHDEAVAAGKKAQQVLRAKRFREDTHLGDLGETKVFVGRTVPDYEWRKNGNVAEMQRLLAKKIRRMKILFWTYWIVASIFAGIAVGRLLILIF